jgi:hypothetical protein
MLTQISVARDFLVEAHHNELDSKVVELCSGFEPASPKHILQAIISTDTRLHAIANVDEMLKAIPVLEDLLQECWKKRSFKDIRQLGLS